MKRHLNMGKKGETLFDPNTVSLLQETLELIGHSAIDVCPATERPGETLVEIVAAFAGDLVEFPRCG